MTATMGNEPNLHPDRFFAGFLAGLKIVHPERLTGNRLAFNRAFQAAIEKPNAHLLNLEQLEIDYDPLYGVSPWFERQLTRAQRDLLVSFPNPSYQMVDVKLNREQADLLLEKIGHRDAFIALANAFLAGLQTK